MGMLDGKVAFITGAARGQGRSHAVRLAQEGADIIAVDLCAQPATVSVPGATPEDLAETVALVEKQDRRIVSRICDVRDVDALSRAAVEGVAELGRLDVVVANAGICPLGADLPITAFADAFDVDFVGVVNTVHAALPYLKSGASIITTGSVAGMIAATQAAGAGVGPTGHGGMGYNLAKSFVHQYTKALALQLAPLSIRANAIHPTNVNTPMLQSEPMYRVFRPDLENPTAEDAVLTFPLMNAMPIPYIEPRDVSNIVCFLASDESRYVTGVPFLVDAGAMLKF
jgi:SDR family mycofactocin-dependent oxidoreductase